MLSLRPFKNSDAETIVTWFRDELTFRRWSSDRFENYPITAEDLLEKYVGNNGDCEESDNFYPMTAYDESGAVGHLIMRYTSGDRFDIRLGFVIVDDTKRGCGYGKQMISLALKYAFEILHAKRVTIGVFANNPAAYHCYLAAGFHEVEMEEPVVCELMGEEWSIIELEMTEYPAV